MKFLLTFRSSPFPPAFSVVDRWALSLILIPAHRFFDARAADCRQLTRTVARPDASARLRVRLVGCRQISFDQHEICIILRCGHRHVLSLAVGDLPGHILSMVFPLEPAQRYRRQASVPLSNLLLLLSIYIYLRHAALSSAWRSGAATPGSCCFVPPPVVETSEISPMKTLSGPRTGKAAHLAWPSSMPAGEALGPPQKLRSGSRCGHSMLQISTRSGDVVSGLTPDTSDPLIVR